MIEECNLRKIYEKFFFSVIHKLSYISIKETLNILKKFNLVLMKVETNSSINIE